MIRRMLGLPLTSNTELNDPLPAGFTPLQEPYDLLVRKSLTLQKQRGKRHEVHNMILKRGSVSAGPLGEFYFFIPVGRGRGKKFMSERALRFMVLRNENAGKRRQRANKCARKRIQRRQSLRQHFHRFSS